MAALEDETSGQNEEAICSLGVARRSETDGGDATGLHAVGWVIFFMNLAIGAKRRPTVMLGIEFVVEDDLTRAKPRGYAVVHRDYLATE